MKVALAFLVVQIGIGAFAQFDWQGLQNAVYASAQWPTAFSFPTTDFALNTDPSEYIAPPQYQFNREWATLEKLQRYLQRQLSRPNFNSVQSLQYARPHRPRRQYHRKFYDIYRRLDNNSNMDEETDNEMESTNDDFDGRSVVAPGQYPHMAAIGYTTTEDQIEFKCGGSLISDSFVVTAAHCCYLNGDVPVLVKFGIINLKEGSENTDTPQNRLISEIILHPLYNATLLYNDIALLKLQEPVFFTRFVRPIRLWARDNITYDNVFTMGYGSTSFAKAPTNILTELDLSVVPWQNCNEVYPPDASAPHGITDTQICAKDFVKNRDTCQGDSGGPLQLNLKRRRRRLRRKYRFYLVGIISYGEVCGSGSPGVYTRVSSYIDWIASIVWPEEFQNF